jgi:tripartite-type tricarboxylate transporter receptor subunit TctC
MGRFDPQTEHRRDVIRTHVKRLLTLGLASVLALPVLASDYPARPIKLLVGYAAGGPTDIAARRLGAEMTSALGQPIVVENRPGVSGMLAMNQLKRLPADGYTLALATTPVMAIAPALNPAQRFDAVNDFTPVGKFVEYTMVLLVSAKSPYTTVQQLVDAARQKPGKVTYSSSGIGGTSHIAGEMLARATSTELLHVPYKGSAPATADLISGHVDFMFDVTSSAQPYVASGQLRALAVTTPQRSSALPSVPTMLQSGIRNIDVLGWFGIFAPPGLPAEVLTRLEGAIKSAIAQPRMKDYAKEGGIELVFEASKDFRRTIGQDVVFWERTLGDADIRP